MLVIVNHPPNPRPALIVETTDRITDAGIARLKQRLLGSGCSNGLLFDGDECLILRDAYSSLDVGSIEEDGRVRTDQLFARIRSAGRTLDERVLAWLESMSASWNTALPLDGAVSAPFITDIVPAVSGSQIREVA